MSTVPKLTYAKIGKASKSKAESASSELLRSKQEKSDDLFSHMNQQNLNYIKKELKLKKNRSDQERPGSPHRDHADSAARQQDQDTHRYKVFQKYRGDEEVSEKEPHLEDTQRRSDEEKPLNIFLPEDVEEDYQTLDAEFTRNPQHERHLISTSHQGNNYPKIQEKTERNVAKMYQSLPYGDPKKRMASIEGFFGQAISTNLNKQDGGLFIQFLEEYISDLNQSKHLKSREQEDSSIDKKRNEERRKRTIQRQDSQVQVKNRIQLQIQQNRRKLDRLNRNSDTFGQPNSKFSVQSRHSNSSIDQSKQSLYQSLKEEKLNCLILAQQIDKLRKLLALKQEIIKKVQTDNDLLKEELRHVKTQQEIINKNKKNTNNLEYSSSYRHFQKGKHPNDQNQVIINDFTSYPHNHQRHASTNPNRTTNSYRSSVRPVDDGAELFQQFAPAPYNHEASRHKKERKGKQDNGSLQKWQKEYNDFLLQEKKNSRYARGIRKGREGLL